MIGGLPWTRVAPWRSTQRWAGAALIALALVSLRARDALADRYEASVVVRPTGTLGRLAEDVRTSDGSSVIASVYGAGLDLGASYGLRNWLDVGLELGAAGFTQAAYDPATVMISNQPHTGRIERTTRAAQARIGATLRLGVAWVPFLYLGAGLGGRQRTAATLVRDDHGGAVGITPDGMDAGISFDVITAVRVGLEHRIDRRWTMGLAASASHSIGLGTPSLDTVSAGISVAYTWYPTLL